MPPRPIAYFSPEFGITEVLPQYSGGLGILAGDHLKSASDLGVPIVGVGLFYKTGYFKQSLNRDGWQQETYPVLDPDGLPLSLLREDDGSACVITLDLPGGRELHAHVWRAQVGRVPLLLLDSDVPDNDEAARNITNRLYGGGGEQRLQQEMLLGIGGVRALRLWSRLTGAPAPDVYHTNEGHAGFLGVERIHELTTEHEARLRRGAGGRARGHGVHHAHPGARRHRPLRRRPDRAALRRRPGPGGRPGRAAARTSAPRTTPAASRACSTWPSWACASAPRANGVSKLHGVVSREMFDGLWPGFDDAEVPITSVTNGVHAGTWVDRRVYELADKHLGTPDVERDNAWERIGDVPRDEIWATKRELRQQLVKRGPPPRAVLVEEARREPGRARLGRRHPRPGRADHRLRPPRPDLQAAHPHAARPRAAQAPAARPGAADPARHRRQVPPGRRDRQAAHPADGQVRRRPRGPPPHRLPARTTTSPWRSTSTRAATSG